MKALKGIVITLVVVMMGLLISCNQTQTKRPGFGMNLEEVRKEYNGNKAKYVFYFIGDGMGMPQISATERYLAALDGNLNSRTM
ncbi:MAG: hypothetical protein JXR48_10890 [Candidatus Delongbacteria bacterium]|nr:hypothetical protein [Candidatus Delongbacteria bacterium]MBN2835458.1 hypothetical protein [Candidatus Delongbacteria bacterium]